MPLSPVMPEPRNRRIRTVSAWSSAWCARATAVACHVAISSSKNATRARRPASSRLSESVAAMAFTSMRRDSKGILWRSAKPRQNSSSASDSEPRRPWLRWAATRRSGIPCRLASRSRSAVESAPPERPIISVSPVLKRCCSRTVPAMRVDRSERVVTSCRSDRSDPG